ncbi:MAG: DUF4363 family protein [Bacillota bacterium]
MRLLTVLLIIFLAVIALGIWTNHSLESAAKSFDKDIGEVQRAVQGKDWDTAENKVTEIEKEWDKKAKWWPAMLDHQEIDNIKFSIGRLKGYVKSKNESLTQGELSELKLIITHIPEKESVSLKNIF